MNAQTKSSCLLSWKPPRTPTEDDDEGPVESYEIEQWSTTNDYTVIGTSVEPKFLAENLSPTETYTYRTRGVNQDGKGPYSDESEAFRPFKGNTD